MGKDGNRDSAGSLGERLVELRKKHGYSQQEIADRLSVTRQTISNWECGQGAPALDKAAELAAIYRISLDELAGLAGERKRRAKTRRKRRPWIFIFLRSWKGGAASWNLRKRIQ